MLLSVGLNRLCSQYRKKLFFLNSKICEKPKKVATLMFQYVIKILLNTFILSTWNLRKFSILLRSEYLWDVLGFESLVD